MKSSLKIDGYVNGAILVNSPPVLIQRVNKMSDDIGERKTSTTGPFLAKTTSFYDPRESKKIEFEAQIIYRIYETLGVQRKTSSDEEKATGSSANIISPLATEIDTYDENSAAYYAFQRIPLVLKVEKSAEIPVLLFRDSGGKPIHQFLQEKKSLMIITKLMAMAAEGLQAIHTAQIAHLNISPDCLFARDVADEQSSMSLEIFDFRNSLFVGDSGSSYLFNYENNASYISPEQSGRMNKKIDARSDIYSLGIVFWELVVGSHPFQGAEKENLVYYHNAKKIPDAHLVQGNCPKVLSAIISKMICKDRSERYQNISALKFDLFEILPDQSLSGNTMDDEEFRAHLQHFDNFRIASRDKTNLLVLKDDAIQRPVEISKLKAVFARDTVKSPLAVVCLKGKEKTGRRSIVAQLAEHVQSMGGILIDCTTTDDSSNPLVVFIDKIARSILSRTTDQLLATRNSLLQGVGREDLGILIRTIPSILTIMGVNFKTPMVENPSKSAVSNALKRFLEILLINTSNTVLYIPRIMGNGDALDFLATMVGGKRVKTMIIINYDNMMCEVSDRFFLYCSSILQDAYHILELQNLSVYEISAYLSNILMPTNGNLNGLAELLFRKCGGNPFYLKELISLCATSNLFYFDEEMYVWQWSMDSLNSKLKITSNVADSLINQLGSLSNGMIEILTAASIMGTQFEMLHIEKTIKRDDFDSNLAKLVEMQYLTPLVQTNSVKKKRTSSFTNRPTLFQKSTLYEISSPRIRLSIIDNLSTQQRGSYCTKLVLTAKDLGLSLAKYQYDEFLISCNENIDAIDDAAVLETLFGINLTLARYSIKMGNTNDALSDFRHCDTIIMKNPAIIWKNVPEDAFEMKTEFARLLVQNNAAEAKAIEMIIRELESKQNSREKRLIVIILQLRFLELQFDYVSMAHLGYKTLVEFGISNQETSYNENMEEFFRLAIGSPHEVFKERISIDLQGESKLLREIMFLSCIASEIIEPGSQSSGLLPRACCYELQNGFSIYSCLFFSAMIKHFIKPGNNFNYSMFRWTAEFSMLLIDVGERETRNAATLAAMNGMDLVWPATKMVSCAKDYLEASLQSATFDAIQTIEIIYLYNLSVGTKLADISATIKSFAPKAKNSPLLPHFLEDIATDTLLDDTEVILSSSFKVLPIFLTIVKTLLYNSADDKLAMIPAISSLLEKVYTMTAVIDLLMMKYLFITDILRNEEDEEVFTSLMDDAESTFQLLSRYSEIATMKEQKCKFLLVSAENCRAESKSIEAMAFYEEAIETAASSKNVFIQALANEYYAMMLIDLQSKKLSKPCLLESINLWTEYGCDWKVKQMKVKFSFILNQHHHHPVNRVITGRRESLWENVVRNTVLISNRDSVVKKEDKNAIIEFSSVLNQEKNLEVLLQKVSTYLITTANATKCIILLSEKDVLSIHAISVLDDNGKIIHDTSVVDAEKVCKAPLTPVFYVWRSGEKMLFNDYLNWDDSFKADEYLRQFRPKSFLCLPIVYQDGITGVVYLENSLQKRAFVNSLVDLVTVFFSAASVAIENARLQKKNQELANELESKNRITPKVSFDSPIQKVLESLQTLKTKFEFDPAETQNIDMMMQILNSDDLFKADLNFDSELDDETEKWIKATVMPTDRQSNNNNSSSPLPEASIRTVSEPENIIKSYLELTDPMDFDIFKFSDLTNQQPLHYLSMHMFRELRLFESLKIRKDKASKFFQRIESNYNQLPYHNSIHAADLLKIVRCILLDTPLCSKFTEAELACLIIAGAIHDVDHPGVNNNFLMQLNHPLAVLYNDCSVLENHHLAFAFEIARESDSNIFGDLDPHLFTSMRKSIIQSVLATDLATHFQILNKFKAKVAAGNLKMEEPSDRSLVMEMAMKCGDLSNPTRPSSQSIQWSFRIMEEFFKQGEREKLLGLPVSQFMDQSNTNIPKCQLGFIDFLVAPLYDVWTLFSSTPFTESCIKNISRNRENWKEWQEDPALMPPFPSRTGGRKDEMLDMKTLNMVKFGSANDVPKTNYYWTMVPAPSTPSVYPTRLYGSGMRIVNTPDHSNSGSPLLSNSPTVDVSLSGRPSFRKVVQVLMTNKQAGAKTPTISVSSDSSPATSLSATTATPPAIVSSDGGSDKGPSTPRRVRSVSESAKVLPTTKGLSAIFLHSNSPSPNPTRRIPSMVLSIDECGEKASEAK